MTVATFYVTKQENGSLLSCSTSQELGLIYFPCEAVKLKKAPRTKITRNRHPESKSQTPGGVRDSVCTSLEPHLNLLLIIRPSKLFVRQSQSLLLGSRGGLPVCSSMSII